MTPRQADQAQAERLRAENLRRADGDVLTFHGIPIVFDEPLTRAEQMAGDAAWAALNGREHG